MRKNRRRWQWTEFSTYLAMSYIWTWAHPLLVLTPKVVCPFLPSFFTPMARPKVSKSNGVPQTQEASTLQQYVDSDGHFSLVRSVRSICGETPPVDDGYWCRRNFRLADLVTIMNGVCGAFSIFSSAGYLASNDDDYLWWALALPLAGLMFDFLDGKVARWRKSTSLLGQELDSLADLASRSRYVKQHS